MCKDVITQDQICLSVRPGKAFRNLLSKKLHKRFETFSLCNLRDIFRGFNANATDTGGFEILQEIPVITGDLDNQAVSPESKFGDVPFGRIFGMPYHQIGKRGEIEIFRE